MAEDIQLRILIEAQTQMATPLVPLRVPGSANNRTPKRCTNCREPEYKGNRGPIINDA